MLVIHLPQYRSVLYTTDISTSFTLQSTQHRYLTSAFHYLDWLSTSNNAKAILHSCLRTNSEVRNNGERLRQSHKENAPDTLLSTRQRSLFLPHWHCGPYFHNTKSLALPSSVSHLSSLIFCIISSTNDPPTSP